MDERPSDRAGDLFWLFMVIVAFVLALAGIGCVIIALGVAFSDRDFPVAALFAVGAAVCFGLNRLIVNLDDKRDARKKTQAVEERAKQVTEIPYSDDTFGRLTFRYDSAEDEITLGKEQLPEFANGMSLSAVAYDDLITREGSPENAARKVIEAMRRVYNDKDEIISGMCGGYLSRCQSDGCTEYNGETVDEDMIRRTMQYERLWVGCDDGIRCNAELKAVPAPAILFDTAATAVFYVDEDGYEYKTRSNW